MYLHWNPSMFYEYGVLEHIRCLLCQPMMTQVHFVLAVQSLNHDLKGCLNPTTVWWSCFWFCCLCVFASKAVNWIVCTVGAYKMSTVKFLIQF